MDTTPASTETISATEALQASNRRRVTALEATAGVRIPDFTGGIVELLADHTLGAGTEARWRFTLEWEVKYAQWLEATEAEVRKAKLLAEEAAGRPVVMTQPGKTRLHTVGEISGL